MFDEEMQNSYLPEEQTPVIVPVKKKKSGFGKRLLTFACLGLCFGLFAGIGLYAVVEVTGIGKNAQTYLESMQPGEKPDPIIIDSVEDKAENQKDKPSSGKSEESSFMKADTSEIVAQVMPAMVSITNNYTRTSSYWGRTYSNKQQSSGSGIIIGQNDKELLVATNYHVIAEADELEVSFIDGSIAQAQLKGQNADMDLAVIAILLDSLDPETRGNIAVAKMGDSDALLMGEPVIAIGNALGYGQSMTGGYVSALNREIELEDGSTGTFIQTDAAINPGNSGGALLNMNGEVVGINSNKFGGTTVEGMGFAIPITAAEPILENLMAKETRTKVADGNIGYMGISLQPVTSELNTLYGVPTGIFITGVEEGSPAEKAGILPRDIITYFDGDRITSYEDLQGVLQYFAPGDTAKFTVMRQVDGEYVERELEITLGRNPNR